MKKQLVKILSVLLTIAFLFPHEVSAQRNPKSFYFTNPKKKSITIPFKLINNLIIIPLQINGSDTLNFILDTGVSNTLLTWFPKIDSISLKYGKEVLISGVGSDEYIVARHSYGNQIDICGLMGQYQDLCVLDKNSISLSEKLGIRVNGLIGSDLLKDFIVEINYNTKKLSFFQPKDYKYKKSKKVVTLPIELFSSKPYIYISVKQDNNKVSKLKLLIDTGASWAIWLDAFSSDSVVVPKDTAKAILGVGLNGEVYGFLGRVKGVTIGQYEIKDVLTSYPDSSIAIKTDKDDNRNGSIGADLLRRFNLVIDYRDELLTLCPNYSYNDPFQHDMSGIEIDAIVPGFPFYEIGSIWKGSPAHKAGLLPGDQIVSINNMMSKNFALSDIIYLLQEKDGKKIKILVRREDKLFKAVFRLKKVI
jgi:hypothetical protein